MSFESANPQIWKLAKLYRQGVSAVAAPLHAPRAIVVSSHLLCSAQHRHRHTAAMHPGMATRLIMATETIKDAHVHVLFIIVKDR